MIINKHDLDGSDAAGNGHHGHCKHCHASLVTDLGYCSWDGVKCIDREIIDTKDMPDKVLSYVEFNGLIWKKDQKLFIKPYSDVVFTLDGLVQCISVISS